MTPRRSTSDTADQETLRWTRARYSKPEIGHARIRWIFAELPKPSEAPSTTIPISLRLHNDHPQPILGESTIIVALLISRGNETLVCPA